MNGPFYVPEWTYEVRDASRSTIATGGDRDDDDHTRQAKAVMVCDALNSIYYAMKAAGKAA